jgi:hypothetical protein
MSHCTRSLLTFVTILVAGRLLAQTPASAFDANPWPVVEKGPLRVYILAGQSNMQGHAALRTLEYLIYNEETAAEYQQWKDRDGRWTERKDVWIWTTDGDRSGNLKPGYGANEWKLGPELGFGEAIGRHHDEQVLLIKTCWGGRSVRRDFLPPSAEQPTENELEKELARLRERKADATLEEVKSPYGNAYREMIAHVHDVLGSLETRFPGYTKDRGHEIAGFVFFQGWNDYVDGEQRAEKYASYTKRLGHLIADLRKDLGVPKLPVVIGELGVDGKRGDFQAAQAAVAELPELAGTVKLAKTCEFWEPDVAKLVDDDVWRGPDWVRFYNVGSERAYHYLGSARIYSRMGKSFAASMIELESAK